MKQGRSLVNLATELERQVATRKDYIAPTEKLTAVVGDGAVGLDGLPTEDRMPLRFTELAHGQIANELSIPKPYYDRMVHEAPALWAQNVNHWLRAKPQARLVRVLDGRVRSFLSDRFRPLDNFELLEAIIPAVRDLGDVEVVSCEVTERRMYIKLVRPSVAWDIAMVKAEAMRKAGDTHSVRPGEDVVRAAAVISNSEVGDGALSVDEAIERLVCFNLATMNKAVKKYHVGRKHGNGGGNGDDGIFQLLSDEARQADDRAFWLKVRDVVKIVFDEKRFRANAERFANAAGDRITGDVEKVVEVTAVRFGLTDATRAGMLRHLIEGGDLSRLGLVNAVTRQSQDEADYDAASEMERLGGKILELPAADWKVLNASNN